MGADEKEEPCKNCIILQEEIIVLVRAIREVEWLDISTDLLSRCPLCARTKEQGHREKCLVGEALNIGAG